MPIPSFWDMPFANSFCYPISPFVSIFCIRKKIKPNTVTLLMIICGVVAGLVLLLPSSLAKFSSFLLYYLWYTLDLSDGEVARFTQQFSKGGKYLDWSSHLICHSLFTMSMWYSLYQLGFCNLLLTISTFVLLSSELIGRNRIAMDTLYGFIENTPNHDWKPMSIVKYIYGFFVYFPNVVIIFPLLLGLEMIFKMNFFYSFYLVWAFFYSIVMLRVFFMFIWRMYRSE